MGDWTGRGNSCGSVLTASKLKRRIFEKVSRDTLRLRALLGNSICSGSS